MGGSRTGALFPQCSGQEFDHDPIHVDMLVFVVLVVVIQLGQGGQGLGGANQIHKLRRLTRGQGDPDQPPFIIVVVVVIVGTAQIRNQGLHRLRRCWIRHENSPWWRWWWRVSG